MKQQSFKLWIKIRLAISRYTNNRRKQKTLLVKSIQPQRVDGEHNIIYLPLSMKMITIETEEAETIIRDFTE